MVLPPDASSPRCTRTCGWRSGVPQHFVWLTAVVYDSVVRGRAFHLAEMLAAQGHQVTFVDMPSTGATLDRLRRFWRPRPTTGRVQVVRLAPYPGYLRHQPSPLTHAWVRYLRWSLQRRIANLAQAILVVSTPWWLPVVEGLPHALLCYDVMDHVQVHTSAGHLAQFLAWDDALIARSHLLTVVSPTLEQDLRTRTPTAPIVCIPNGVLSAWLDQPVTPIPRTCLTSQPQQPIVGFLGAVFEWIDLPLLAAVAQALPDVTLVLVGPTRPGVTLEALQRLPNVVCCGPQPHSEVPRWIGAFDVCLIPFTRDCIATAADPIKLYEYSALGKPIVSTVPFAGVPATCPLWVAATASEVVRAITAALATDTPSHQAARRAFARQQTWEQRAGAFATAVQASLARGEGQERGCANTVVRRRTRGLPRF